MAPLVAVVRDHGSGTVTVDSQGRAQAHWKLNHPDDRAMAVLAQQELAKIHHAAGAHTIQTLHQKPTEWHSGESFDAFLDELRRAPHEANDLVVSSAHPQGGCRLGADSFTSVADGDGQLHDIPGVWIGDGSGFPSAVGVNPMITIMAMARRTARAASRRQRWHGPWPRSLDGSKSARGQATGRWADHVTDLPPGPPSRR
jgi:choline dehydrogenase-like flavoprotein